GNLHGDARVAALASRDENVLGRIQARRAEAHGNGHGVLVSVRPGEMMAEDGDPVTKLDAYARLHGPQVAAQRFDELDVVNGWKRRDQITLRVDARIILAPRQHRQRRTREAGALDEHDLDLVGR